MTTVGNVKRGYTEEDIGQRAIQIWEREGRPEGRALGHWLQAEAQLAAEERPGMPTDEVCGSALPIWVAGDCPPWEICEMTIGKTIG